MKATVALDVDSVLFPVNELVVLPRLNADLGLNLSPEDIADWDYESIDPGAKAIAYDCFRRSDLYDKYDLSHTPGALEVVQRLRTLYRVIAVSSPFAGHATSKWRYLQRCGFNHGDIVLTGDKSVVGFDVLVDDAPCHLASVGPDRALVFDQPYNRLASLSEYERAYGWANVPFKVARLLK